MKQLCLIILLICSRPINTLAQRTAFRWREKEGDKYISINTSASRYWGDLSERYNFSHLQLSWGVEGHGRYRFNERLSVRSDIGVYSIRADQRYMKNKANYLSFSATSFSTNVSLQWDLKDVGAIGNQNNIVYLMAGMGVTKLAPSTVLGGVSYSLPAYQTEGQRYPLWVPQLSYGVGIPVVLNAMTQLQFEGRFTHILSDHVDDVSTQYADKSSATVLEKRLADKRIDEGVIPNAVNDQRGNSTNNDGYFLFTLQFVHKFR